MAADLLPKRHVSAIFHRHNSTRRKARSTRSASPPEHRKLNLFEGTDTVAHNRKVAVQRIAEIHDALDLKYRTESATSDGSTSPSSSSSDPFTAEFSALNIPGAEDEVGAFRYPAAEVRAFKYLLRKWDSSATPDADFDNAVEPFKLHFEEAAVKYFIWRIALWDKNEEALKEGTGKKAKDRKWMRKEKENNSALGQMWTTELGFEDYDLRDGLKEVTTREGLAQLLCTLFQDKEEPLTPEFFRGCREAVKKTYGIQS
ncbi:uncharacterized protein K460DRAFT_334723 [Cucurbitaria berberidis CBS 394.84]|uniref:Uncharacterized protein n=1 Tax=Cucurbitaria berberidis CBS 394.84 TaxID=1168544 RepID=A0A9P4GN77_9PLEO|nr:uncharacterized protein K460DRAFT_334723 [Cucurbitaria berberidis CBS 394.84]KAF1848519.1 hypothetical protein K460DRAFT_334723 [Cucurbitaria berberidis CBS 394.84]